MTGYEGNFFKEFSVSNEDTQGQLVRKLGAHTNITRSSLGVLQFRRHGGLLPQTKLQAPKLNCEKRYRLVDFLSNFKMSWPPEQT